MATYSKPGKGLAKVTSHKKFTDKGTGAFKLKSTSAASKPMKGKK